jgi:hypothetical protein
MKSLMNKERTTEADFWSGVGWRNPIAIPFYALAIAVLVAYFVAWLIFP